MEIKKLNKNQRLEMTTESLTTKEISGIIHFKFLENSLQDFLLMNLISMEEYVEIYKELSKKLDPLVYELYAL